MWLFFLEALWNLMGQFKQQLQDGCRKALRPVARGLRSLLTPPTPPIEFGWHRIEGGPAVGAHVMLPRNTLIADAITAGDYDKKILEVVEVLVGKDDTCFDIGGHYGCYTLSLAKLASEGQVHTFEPVPAHAERIKEAAKKSAFQHVQVHQVAMAGQNGEMMLQFAEAEGSDDSMAFLDAYGGVDTQAAHEHYRSFARTSVQAVTLDSLSGDLPSVQFIKIDAEGAEAAILGAGHNLISSNKPRLLIELHGIYEALACAEILCTLNYQAILLTDQKTTLPILWASRDDAAAVQAIEKVLGHEPTVMFASLSEPSSSADCVPDA
ncbi:FkbM family methyltransferase [bacterium]|nr:FkbM family methyltransferase [bacterium]MDB4645120.1 FkbM family methyltransferase [Rubripirellula sp.]